MAAHRQHVVRPDEHVHFADRERVVAVRFLFDQVQHHEQGLAVLFDLRTLVAITCILHRQFMQPELAPHLVEFFRRRILQRNPDEAFWPVEPVTDLRHRYVGELGAILVDDTVDQHAATPRPR